MLDNDLQEIVVEKLNKLKKSAEINQLKWRAMRNAMKFLEERAGQATHMSRDPRTKSFNGRWRLANKTLLCPQHVFCSRVTT